MSKKNTWCKPYHKRVAEVLKFFYLPISRRRYNIKVEPCEELKGRQCLILFNHVTAHDQFFLADAFELPIYFIASEDLFSIGFPAKLISWAVAPIPIKKQAQDVKALKTCLKVVKEGGTIALAPEGNRTYSGHLCYIKPTIVSMAKRFKLPIACFRIEGGFGVHPRWSDVVREGEMKAYVSRIIEPEEYKTMSDNELMDIIIRELDVQETGVTGEYKSDKGAEYLERAMYVCPECGLSRFESHGNEFCCTNCGLTGEYTSTKEIVGTDKEFPFRFMADWYDYQQDYVNTLDLAARAEEQFYEDEVSIYKVHLYERKELLHKKATLTLFGGSVTLKTGDFERSISFDEAKAITVLGKNKLDIYCDDIIYQIKGDERFNALKYVHFYNRYKNTKEGRYDDKFLGL